MSTHKKIDMICAVVIILAVVTAALLMYRKGFGAVSAVSGDGGSGMFTANDLEADWDSAAATRITLSDEGSIIEGNGAYQNGGDICIAYGGHYVLTGGLSNGSVIIDADKSDKIWILLDDAAIHAEDGAAIRVEQADKVFLTLAEGTENAVSSGAEYSGEAVEAGVDGTIYSRDDLTINGSGSLAVDASYQHGIVCNDDLVIAGGNITVNAVQDGIHANDSVRVRNAELSISAGDDGITVSNDDETAFLYVESGSIAILECYEGMEAVEITIAGGTIDIRPEDDGINAAGSGENSVIRITGGDITIINEDGRDADGLDSNGSIYMEGGSLFISVSDSGGNCALDYGSENGGECIVSGGIVAACGGSAMAEGFDAGSTQGFLMYNTSASAGTRIRLEDAEGKELLSEEIPCGFSSVVLSTPELAVGDTCTIMVGEESEEITIDNVAASGFAPAGMFGGMRGGGNHGGMPDFRGPADGTDMGQPDGLENDKEAFMPGQMGGGPEMPEGEEGMPAPGEMSGEKEMPESEGGMPVPGGMRGEKPIPEGEGGMSAPGEMSGEMEMPEGEEETFMPGGMRSGPKMQEGGEEMPGPGGMEDGMEMQKDGMRLQRTEDGQIHQEENSMSSGISAGELSLLGISVLILLIGLITAVKIKH